MSFGNLTLFLCKTCEAIFYFYTSQLKYVFWLEENVSSVIGHDALGRTKLHDALGQRQLELSTHTWSGRAPLKRRQICAPADVKQIIFICVLFYFELGGITKHLMTGPSGNSEFCFPSTSMFPSASPRGTLRVSGKQNSLFPLGPVIKCLLFCTPTWPSHHVDANQEWSVEK